MAGGVLGLSILHAFEPSVKMDVIAMLGFIIMAGIVVNSAILLVEQALNHMQEGMRPQEAIIESSRNRLPPIFMTASSLLSFLPLVLSSGAGSELYRYGRRTARRLIALHAGHPGAGANGVLTLVRFS